MKVALVYDLAYPYTLGGGEKRNLSFQQSLQNHGHNIHILCCQFWKSNELISDHSSSYIPLCSPGSKALAKKRTVFSTIRFTYALVKHLALNDYDVVDFCNFPYLPAIAGAIVLKIRRRTYCVTWLEYTGDYWNKLPILLCIMGKILESTLLLASNYSICISEFTKRQSARLSKACVIGYGLSNSELNIENIGRKRQHFIAIGRLEPHKRFDLLMRAFSIFKNYLKDPPKLVVVGAGSDYEKLMELVGFYELTNDVLILTAVDDGQLELLLNASYANIVTSEREGLGLTIIECMFKGIPSIVCRSKYSAATELVEIDKSGIVCEPNEESLAQAMLKILELKNNHWTESLSKVAQKYNLGNLSEKLISFYSEMIAKNGGR